jgi:oxygen-independent coproporphyrinogen III oxidase
MNKETALYIHIPFCLKKCLYCDFASYSGKEALMDEYINALGKEIEYTIHGKIKTIFIGGGTPTFLSCSQLKKLGTFINKLDLKKDVEFTVEGNPGTFTEEKLTTLKNMGVNRLSIGLQAWQNELLKKLGRIHTIEEFLKSYEMALKAGFKNINLDIMFGLPGQTLENMQETLEKSIRLNPTHISCYSLIIEEGTPFYCMYSKNSSKLPSEELEREMYLLCIEKLKAANYNHYEISNFAQYKKECKHNLVYWNVEDYYGVGCAAHSFVNNVRYYNTKNVETYINKISKNDFSYEEVHKNSVEDNMEEFIFMGLRKINGILISDFKRKFGRDIFLIYGEIINKYTKLNLLIIENGRLFLSERGLEISNSIMCDFILT